MKKTLSALLACLAISGCSKVPAGNVGVKVYLLGGNKGIDSEELGPGRYWVGFNEDLYLFPTFTQNYEWTKDYRDGSETDESFTFQTREGLAVNADVGVTYRIDPAKVSLIFQKYRRGVEEITDQYLYNIVRDALVTNSSALPIESVYGAGKADLISNVQKVVSRSVEDLGILIERVYWLGELRLPPTVVTALNAKIEATQMAQQRRNEVEQARAEADKQIEVARGEAEARLAIAKAEAKSIRIKGAALRENPDLINLSAIEKWNGALPTVSSEAIPFINIK